ncbi:MAG: Tim44/TimA family putative adaptor protein [Proteobacteria bacterium]|jgi:predicted lipid-binding transport protein (Tim44 family)|nr:Tim44/TimA family putative adaptor protein [Pseudomonadota bacterium]
MDNESDNLFLIIIAFIAGFIILQLRRTLGEKDGYDGKDEKNAQTTSRKQHVNDEEDNVVHLPTGKKKDKVSPESIKKESDIGLPKESAFYSVLEQVREYDKEFTLPSFIDGAEYAYGMILTAFWKGDTKTLLNTLSREVFEQFEHVIKDMNKKKHHFDNSLNDVEKIELVDASIEGSMAELTLRFKSHMILVIKDAKGEIVEGNTEKAKTVIDIWTFCRDVKRSDPNWTLVHTRNA